MRCRLGEKKEKKIEQLLGKKILCAYTTRKHFIAQVWLDKYDHICLNYKTGEIIK